MSIESHRFTFVVYDDGKAYPVDRYTATLGDYDLGSPTGSGDTPSEAIIDWLKLHGETIDAEAV